MGLLDGFNKNENQQLQPLVFLAPTPEEDKHIRSELTSVVRKKVFNNIILCGVAGIFAIALPIGYIKAGEFSFGTIMIMLLTILACIGGIFYLIKFALPKNKIIYDNFKEGRYGVFTTDGSKMFMRAVHDGKESQYGNVEYLSDTGSRASMSVLFLAHDVHTYHKNKKDVVKVQVVQIEGSKELYGLMYFEKRGYFY